MFPIEAEETESLCGFTITGRNLGEMSWGWSSNMRENEKPVLTIIAQGFLRDLQHMGNVMPALLFYLSFLFLDVLS